MSKKVLVVDDEKLIVKGIKFSLEQDGYDVDCAYDGEEALELVKQNEYDVMLLDVMLPKLTGFEVLQMIREFSMLPVIMLTAKAKKIIAYRQSNGSFSKIEDIMKISGIKEGLFNKISANITV